MRALTRLLLGGALATAALVTPAAAAESCFGTAETVYVCVTTPEVYEDPITQCVYTGGPTCEDVTVPFVGVTRDAEVRCGGRMVPKPFCTESPT